MRASQQEYPENILCVIDGKSSLDRASVERYRHVLEDAIAASLNKQEKHLITRRYEYGKSLTEISDEMRISAANARMIEANALRKLRNPKHGLFKPIQRYKDTRE